MAWRQLYIVAQLGKAYLVFAPPPSILESFHGLARLRAGRPESGTTTMLTGAAIRGGWDNQRLRLPSNRFGPLHQE